MTTTHTNGSEKAVNISAMVGGVAQEVAEAIARPPSNPLMRNRREFTDPEPYVHKGLVTATEHGQEHPCNVLIGQDSGHIHLVPVPYKHSWSPKPIGRTRSGGLLIGIGENLPKSRIPSVANQIVALFVVHGHDWTDSQGQHFTQPYGANPSLNNNRKRRKRTPRPRAFEAISY